MSGHRWTVSGSSKVDKNYDLFRVRHPDYEHSLFTKDKLLAEHVASLLNRKESPNKPDKAGGEQDG